MELCQLECVLNESEMVYITLIALLAELCNSSGGLTLTSRFPVIVADLLTFTELSLLLGRGQSDWSVVIASTAQAKAQNEAVLLVRHTCTCA